MNAAARTIVGFSRSAHVSVILADSHWLIPFSERALGTVLRTTTLSYGNIRFQAPAQLKPLNWWKLNFAGLITLVTLRNVPKMVAIGWREAATQIGEIYSQKLFLLYTLPYSTLPVKFLLVSLCSKNGLTDLHERWLKRRELLWGSALRRSRW
jgi:hypothetical protein